MDILYKCLDTENVEMLPDLFESQFNLHSDVFNDDTIHRVDYIVINFFARTTVKLIKPTTPEKAIVVVEILRTRKALGMMGLQIQPSKISQFSTPFS